MFKIPLRPSFSKFGRGMLVLLSKCGHCGRGVVLVRSLCSKCGRCVDIGWQYTQCMVILCSKSTHCVIVVLCVQLIHGGSTLDPRSLCT